MSRSPQEAHPNWNVCYDRCEDCGATRLEWDDNLAPTCLSIPPGPHRAAILALKAELRSLDDRIACERSNMERIELAVAEVSHGIREAEAKRREVAAGIVALEKET